MFAKKESPKTGIQAYPRVEINFSPQIPPLQKVLDKTQIDVRYSLIAPFAFVHIYWNPEISEVVYEVEEPVLDEREKQYREELVMAMKDLINYDVIVGRSEKELEDYIDRMFKILATELGMDISPESYARLFYYLARDFIGFNEIEPLLRDYFIEDIECNGADAQIYIVHRIFRNLKTNIIFRDTEKLASFVEKLAQRCGKYISYAQPILDGSLPDGSRVNATYTKEITSRGPTFTIRKFTKVPWTPMQLISFNTLSPEMLAYLWMLVQYRMSVLIAGGTGSGKTTLLNAFAFFIPPEARVVTIEDTRELLLPRENWLPSVVRNPTGTEKTGEIDMFDLLKSSFRQMPDYVIVGEVRGAEAAVLFQGMASGHACIGTIHADSVDTVIKRLETPPIELSPSLLNVLDCVCVMTHAIVKNQETRKLKELAEIINVTSEGVALTNTPFRWNPSDDQFYFKRDIRIFEKISKRFGMTVEELYNDFRRRTQLLNILNQKKIYSFEEVQAVVNDYYKNPGNVLRKYGVM